MRLIRQAFHDRLDDAALADAGFAAEQDHLPLAIAGEFPAVHQQRDLGVATDDRRQGAGVRRLETAAGGARAEHPPGTHRFEDTAQGLLAEIRAIHRAADQAVGGRRYHRLIRPGEAFEARCQVRRVAHRQLGDRGIAARGLADHHRPGGDTDADLQRTRRGDRFYRLDDRQGREHRPGGVVLMRARPAEIDHQPVAEVLRDLARVALDRAAAGLLVGLHQAPQVFGVEGLGERRGAHEIAEHDGYLAPFGIVLRRRRRGRRRLDDQLPRRLLDQPPGTERQADFLEIGLGQIGQNRKRDLVVVKMRRILLETESVQPIADIRHTYFQRIVVAAGKTAEDVEFIPRPVDNHPLDRAPSCITRSAAPQVAATPHIHLQSSKLARFGARY